MIGTIASAAVVSVGALAWGAFERNSPLFGRVQRRLPGDEPVAALTFDDGPNPEATPAVLDALGAEGVSATFFVLGRHADRWPAIVERAPLKLPDKARVVAVCDRELLMAEQVSVRYSIPKCYDDYAGMLAAEMSTDSGYMLTWATVIYNDLIVPCVKKPLSEMKRLFITRTLVLPNTVPYFLHSLMLSIGSVLIAIAVCSSFAQRIEVAKLYHFDTDRRRLFHRMARSE